MKKKFNLRYVLQIAFFVLIALISVNHTLVERGIEIPIISSASLHALCPYGGVETFIALVSAGTMVKKVHSAAVALLAIILVLSALFGPVFCSYVCPLGSIQEWISKLGKKLFPKRHNKIMPVKLDKSLRYFRYIVLIWTVYLSTKSLKLVFEAYDPYYALFNFWSGEVAITALIVLGIVLALSLFMERAWCKYACPFGALLGLTNFVKIFKIKRNKSTCISCNLCTKECPMNIDVASKKEVSDHQCISCGVCTSENTCPVSETVVFAANTKEKKHFGAKKVAISILVILIVGIGIAKVTDSFAVKSTKQPKRIETGEFVGMADPADIRGSYSFKDIENAFEVPVETLATAFGIDPVGADSFQLKSLEAMNQGVGTSSVRSFVALFLGIPFDEESDGLPKTAIDVLLEQNKITQDEHKDLLIENGIKPNEEMAHDLEVEQSETTASNANDIPASGAEVEHSLVNGNTTIKDAIELGISQAALEEILKTNTYSDDALVKDVAKAQGHRFSEIKDILNGLLE
jgi:Pyruvate/2-oxoacid:ferredoxin oxidoreductase delta subunit